MEKVLIESGQSVLRSNSLERQKRIRYLVSCSENNLVDARDACPILELYRTARSTGYARDCRFTDHVGKTPCIFEEAHIAASGDVQRALDDFVEVLNKVCSGYAAAHNDNFLKSIKDKISIQ